ncbi:MAG: (4Fe-4S)-binding protein, partial [Pseudaestuariivita sp.]
MGTQSIDSARLSEATGFDVRPACSALCMGEITTAAEAIQAGDAILCCTQEARRFEALADELDLPPSPTLDLRDRAGWTSDTASTLPKMSALIAEATLPAAPTKTMDVVSEGLCLILGPASVTIPAAEQLSEHLGVTVLLENAEDLPETRGYDVVIGRMRRATGALSQFDVRIDALQQIVPGGRGGFTLTAPQDGAASGCDILIDLTGGQPLFPAHEKREGYL